MRHGSCHRYGGTSRALFALTAWRRRILAFFPLYFLPFIALCKHHEGRSGGFTLIELITTLVLLAVLVSLVAPRMDGYIARSQLDSAASQLAGDINYARMAAIRSSQQVVVVIEADRYTIRRPGQTQNGVIKRVDLAAEFRGLTLSTGTSLPDSLHFNSRGLLIPGANLINSVNVQQGARSETLRVLLTGRVHRDY